MKNRKRLIIFGLVVLLIFIVAVYFTFFRRAQVDPITQPSQSATPVPVPTQVLEQALETFDTSNYSDLINKRESDLIAVFGEPDSQSSDERFNYLSYQTDYPIFPTVAYSDNGNVVVVKEILSENDPRFNQNSINVQVQNLPSFIKYTQNLGPSFPVEIYNSLGIALVRHETSQQVFQVWHFAPSTRSQIEQSWGADLANPEDFQFHQDN